MLKKITTTMLIFFTLALFGCTETKDMYSFSMYDYMYTFIQVSMYTTENDFKKHSKEIESTYKMFDALTTSYEALEEDSPYLENIYSINQKINQKVEIDKPLYDILETALAYQTLTNGTFDVTLGKISRIWKELIESVPQNPLVGNYVYMHRYEQQVMDKRYEIISFTNDYMILNDGSEELNFERNKMVFDYEVNEEAITNTINRVNALDISDSEVVLTANDNQYFIELKGSNAQLDLGAISKGYTTELVQNYLIEHNVEYFSISAGSSTIALGKNFNRPNEANIFNVALSDPNTSRSLFRPTYGLVKVKNVSVTTSGNFEQYAVFEGRRYHHIISPFTKQPVSHYDALTVIGKSAGLLDALSTALFVMDENAFELFMNENQDSLVIEVIRYNQDESVSTYIKDTVFEDLR
jgi:thiamine biosynthesis lipoprotein